MLVYEATRRIDGRRKRADITKVLELSIRCSTSECGINTVEKRSMSLCVSIYGKGSIDSHYLSRLHFHCWEK
uniref:Uncharacterized protein n=1 Tax=Amphimedon queenslandica TaxID=400682 RepID=A0A1X7VVU9_AMPQE